MIRKAQREDIAACVTLIRDSFRTVAKEFNITEANAPRFTAYATTTERLTSQFEEGRLMFVYEEAGEIVGYYSLCPLPNNECELSNLCVHESMRHHKIGEQLFEHCVAQAKQQAFDRMFISIVEENQVLRHWYEKLGAEHLGAQKLDCFPFTCGYMKVELK